MNSLRLFLLGSCLLWVNISHCQVSNTSPCGSISLEVIYPDKIIYTVHAQNSTTTPNVDSIQLYDSKNIYVTTIHAQPGDTIDFASWFPYMTGGMYLSVVTLGFYIGDCCSQIACYLTGPACSPLCPYRAITLTAFVQPLSSSLFYRISESGADRCPTIADSVWIVSVDSTDIRLLVSYVLPEEIIDISFLPVNRYYYLYAQVDDCLMVDLFFYRKLNNALKQPCIDSTSDFPIKTLEKGQLHIVYDGKTYLSNGELIH